MAKVVKYRISELEIPQGLLPRVITGTVEEKVKEYADLMENGVEFDPIKVWEREDGRVWVVDGVHRIEASRRIGREYIEGEPLPIKDELHYRMEAIKHNLKHGLALTPDERKLCAQQLYLSGVDEVNIQRLFGVSDRTIRRWLSDIKSEKKEELIKKARDLRERGYTYEEIAKELQVPRRTIQEWFSLTAKTDTMSEIANIKNHSQQHKSDSYSSGYIPDPEWSAEIEEAKRLVKEEGLVPMEAYERAGPPSDYERRMDVITELVRIFNEKHGVIDTEEEEEDDIPETLKKFESPEMKAKVIQQIRKVKEKEEKKKKKKFKTKEEIIDEIWEKLYEPLAEYQVRFCEDTGQRDFRLEDMLAFIDEIKRFFTTGRYLMEKRYLDLLGYWRARKTEGYKQF